MAFWTDTNTPTFFTAKNIQAWSIWDLIKIFPLIILNIKALPELEDTTTVVQLKK